MIKVKLLNPTEDRNEPTFRVMTACKEALKTYSIEITESDDFDYLFVGMNEFMNKKLSLTDSVDWGLSNIETLRVGGDYFLFDGFDSTSLLGSYEVFEKSDAIYLFKNHLLKNKKDINKNIVKNIFISLFLDFFKEKTYLMTYIF